MSTTVFYKKHFKQFDANLSSDGTVKADERNAIYSFIDACDITTELAKSNDDAKEKLIDSVNQGFLWTTHSGKPKYQFLGADPEKWRVDEELGFVIKKAIFHMNLYQQTGDTVTAIENELDEIITEPDKTEQKRRFDKFKKKYSKYFNKKEIAMMWSFRYLDSTNKVPKVKNKDLPFILALPDHSDGKPYYVFNHALKSRTPKVPRTLDTNIDNDVFRPGGHTFPLGRSAGQPGLKEIIHKPNKIEEVISAPEEIIGYL